MDKVAASEVQMELAECQFLAGESKKAYLSLQQMRGTMIAGKDLQQDPQDLNTNLQELRDKVNYLQADDDRSDVYAWLARINELWSIALINVLAPAPTAFADNVTNFVLLTALPKLAQDVALKDIGKAFTLVDLLRALRLWNQSDEQKDNKEGEATLEFEAGKDAGHGQRAGTVQDECAGVSEVQGVLAFYCDCLTYCPIAGYFLKFQVSCVGITTGSDQIQQMKPMLFVIESSAKRSSRWS